MKNLLHYFTFKHKYYLVYLKLFILSRIPAGTDQSASCPDNGMKIYVCLGLIQNRFYDTISWIALLGSSVLLAACSLLFFFTLASRGPVFERVFGCIIFICTSAFISAFFYATGKLHSDSRSILASWGSYYGTQVISLQKRRECAYRRRLLKSMRPFYASMGIFFTIDKSNLLAFWDTVIDKTVFLLVGFPLH